MMYGNAREERLLGDVEATLQLEGTRLAEYGATGVELQKVKKVRNPSKRCTFR